jgi:stress-induced morphogen
MPPCSLLSSVLCPLSSVLCPLCAPPLSHLSPGLPPRRASARTAPLLRPGPVPMAEEEAVSEVATELLQPEADGPPPPPSAAEVEARLRAAVPGVRHVHVSDVSDGHTAAGVASGRALRADGREFRILLVSDAFEGVPTIERHRAVSAALAPELRSGAIHSLPQLKVWTGSQLEDCRRRRRGSPPPSQQAGGAEGTSGASAVDRRCTELLRSLSAEERAGRRAAEAVSDHLLRPVFHATTMAGVGRAARVLATQLEKATGVGRPSRRRASSSHGCRSS